MEPETLIAWVSSLLGSTVVGAWFTSRVGMKKIPHEERTSKADAAETITNSAIALSAAWEKRFEEVLEDLKEVKGKVTALEQHSEEQGKEISTLRRHVEQWVAWYFEFKSNWNELRLQENAPNPPNTKE